MWSLHVCTKDYKDFCPFQSWGGLYVLTSVYSWEGMRCQTAGTVYCLYTNTHTEQGSLLLRLQKPRGYSLQLEVGNWVLELGEASMQSSGKVTFLKYLVVRKSRGT